MSSPVLDIVVPCSRSNEHLLAPCLQKIARVTKVDCSIIALMDGFLAEEVQPMRDLLRGLEGHVVLRANAIGFPTPVYLNKLLAAVTPHLTQRGKYLAFVFPHLHVHDENWFWRVQAPFRSDGMAGVSMFGFVSGGDVASKPMKVPRTFPGVPSGVLLSRRFFDHHATWPDMSKREDIGHVMATAARSTGCTVWAMPDVKCDVFEHKPHIRPAHVPTGKKIGATAGADPGRDR